MLHWVEVMLKTYIETCPDGIHPLILLDSYKCNMMGSVVADLGMQVEHIPEGCTGLCQPIDVGIGKPLKIVYATSGKHGHCCNHLTPLSLFHHHNNYYPVGYTISE